MAKTAITGISHGRMTSGVRHACVRGWLLMQSARRRAADERGDISSNLVWVAGFVLAAILVVGVLYAKLNSAAESIDVGPGV